MVCGVLQTSPRLSSRRVMIDCILNSGAATLAYNTRPICVLSLCSSLIVIDFNMSSANSSVRSKLTLQTNREHLLFLVFLPNIEGLEGTLACGRVLETTVTSRFKIMLVFSFLSQETKILQSMLLFLTSSSIKVLLTLFILLARKFCTANA